MNLRTTRSRRPYATFVTVLGFLVAAPALGAADTTQRLGPVRPRWLGLKICFPVPTDCASRSFDLSARTSARKDGVDLAYAEPRVAHLIFAPACKAMPRRPGCLRPTCRSDMSPACFPHAQARGGWASMGRIWSLGQASCSRSDPQSCKLAPVAEKGAQVTVKVDGSVEAKRGNVQIGVIDKRKVTVVAQPDSGQFKTSVTLVHFRGLQGRSDQAVRIDPATVLDLDFPRLASERPLAMFRWRSACMRSTVSDTRWPPPASRRPPPKSMPVLRSAATSTD